MVVASLVDSLSKIGAIGGIISFVGVGLMILLVAAQSRQIRAMREWIDAEPERQAETAQRVIAEVQRRIAAARERRAQQAAQAPGMPVVPGQPRQAPAPGTLGATPEARAVAAAKAGDSTSGAATEILPEGASVPPSVGPPPTPDTPGGPPVFAPLTPAGAEAGTDEGAGDGVDDLGDSPFDPSQDTQLSDTVPDEYDPLPPSTAFAGGPDARFADDYGHYEDEHEEHAGNRVLFGVGAAALVAGIVIAAFVLFGGGDEKTPVGNGDNSGQTAKNDDGGDGSGGGTTKATTPTEIDPASIRVTVLNGTKVNGRAAAITDTLAKQQYTTGQPNSLSSAATVATSMVEYRPGSNNQAKAKQVADDLGLDASAVQPIDASVSAAAPESADVVVLIGQDLAGSTTGTTG